MIIDNGINEETILHVWNWSFKTIKENIKEIVNAGYTWIQISPVQGTKDKSLIVKDWWMLYQPINFKIGNFQIGSRAEFIEMCAEAHRYGLKVMVDVILNHMANRGGGSDSNFPHETVESFIRDDINFWHERKKVENWNDRWQVTHWCIGLPDLNTSNHMLQDMIIDFLNDVIECGADGLRFDAAKHIELPEDPGGSDFWPRVIQSLKNKEKLFLYGEVLQCGASNYEKYTKYMRLSAEGYSYAIRRSVGYKAEKNINNAKEYKVPYGVNGSNLVTWVESHDDYASDIEKSFALSEWQIKMGWAIIAARSESIPLFFNRPKGKMWLEGTMGEAGNDFWKSSEIVAINKFRLKMKGEKENIITLGNNLMIIERGNKGVIMINIGQRYHINIYTSLKDGMYKDKISEKVFYVRDGQLNGTVEEGKISIIYHEVEEDFIAEDIYYLRDNKVFFTNPLRWNKPRVYIYKEVNHKAIELSQWPGREMYREGENIYSYPIEDYWSSGRVIFTNGISQIPEFAKEGLLILKNK